jgi:peptidoglycan/xylan/chitin deacetylase (PgdA/CDA1 family)
MSSPMATWSSDLEAGDLRPERGAVSDNPIEVERRLKVFDEGHQPHFAEPLVPREDTRALVLMYHSIDKSQHLRTVWPWDFEAHIERLRKEHVEIVRLSQLIDFMYGDIQQLPARVAVITVDDGEVLFHKYAWPILKKHRAPFALGIITQPTEVSGHARALSWAQLGEMLASGLCEIASHSHKHVALTGMKSDAIDFELNHSRRLIAEHTGFVPQAFIYPLGAFDRRVETRVRSARYRAAFTAVGGPVSAATSPFRIHRFKMQRTTSYTAFARFFERAAATR